MKRALFLTLSLFSMSVVAAETTEQTEAPAPSSDPVEQVFVASHAEPPQDCNLVGRDGKVFGIDQSSQKLNANCTVSVPKTLFFQRYQYCALSGINEYNDDRFSRAHDFGSQCSFNINDDSVSFRASRGFGLENESTSSLYCVFTCVKNQSGGPAGDDLGVIVSQPLDD